MFIFVNCTFYICIFVHGKTNYNIPIIRKFNTSALRKRIFSMYKYKKNYILVEFLILTSLNG